MSMAAWWLREGRLCLNVILLLRFSRCSDLLLLGCNKCLLNWRAFESVDATVSEAADASWIQVLVSICGELGSARPAASSTEGKPALPASV